MRKLATFPAEEVKTLSLFLFLFINTTVRLIQVFTVTQSTIKPGRVKWSDELFLPQLPTLAFRLILFLLGGYVATTLALPMVIEVFTAVTFYYGAAIVLMLIAVSVRKTPVGAPNRTNKYFLGLMIPFFLLSIFSIGLLGGRLQFPVGEAATVPYLLAGFIVAVIESVVYLIDTMTPSRLLSNLQDLRNDIIFLRVDIDEALKRYETLTEGETLPDAVQKELSEVLSDLSVVEYAHTNMGGLIKNMFEQLPLPEDSPQAGQQKRERIAVFRDSYGLHKAKCLEIAAGFKEKADKLNKRLGEVLAVSKDAASESHLRINLQQRAQALDSNEKQLDAAMRDINFYVDNPEKLPGELQEQIKQLRHESNAESGERAS